MFCADQKMSRPLADAILPQLPELYTILETPKQQLMMYEGAGHIAGAASSEYIKSICYI